MKGDLWQYRDLKNPITWPTGKKSPVQKYAITWIVMQCRFLMLAFFLLFLLFPFLSFFFVVFLLLFLAIVGDDMKATLA